VLKQTLEPGLLVSEAERSALRHFARNTKKPNYGHLAVALRSLFFRRWTLHFGMGWTVAAHASDAGLALTINPSGVLPFRPKKRAHGNRRQ
jgi:hypothetical protein